MKPLVLDLFCGRFGWSKGFIAEGYRAIGVDLAPPIGATVPEGAELIIQDVLTLHGSQLKDAACIVCSPPCQRYSYMSMPWGRSKREIRWQEWQRASPFSPGFDLNDLFDACFRIQREASEAAGRYIPMVVENVKGAQKWVGRAKARFGSYYLWGDVESVGGRIVINPRFGQTLRARNGRMKFPAPCGPRLWKDREVPRLNDGDTESGHGQNPVTGNKGFARRFEDTPMARFSSRSSDRKAASAAIAEIPLELARWAAKCYKPEYY